PTKLMPPKKKFFATKPFANGVIVKPLAGVDGITHDTLPPVKVTVAAPGELGGIGKLPSVTSMAAYVTVSPTLLVAENLICPFASVTAWLGPVTMECPLPCDSVMSLPDVPFPFASCKVTVIVAGLLPSAATVLGRATIPPDVAGGDTKLTFA